MAKPRKGWMTIQVALPVESVRLMKLLATLRNETHGETLNEALLMSAPKLRPAVEGEEECGPFSTEEAVRFMAPFYGPGGLFEKKGQKKPALVQVAEAIQEVKAAERKQQKKRVGPLPAPPQPEDITLKAEAYGWTWERLLAALEQIKTPQRHLTKALGLSNISPWGDTGIPPKWHPAIHRFLLEQGWKPEAEQATIFDR